MEGPLLDDRWRGLCPTAWKSSPGARPRLRSPHVIFINTLFANGSGAGQLGEHSDPALDRLAGRWGPVSTASSLRTTALTKCKLYAGVGSAAYTDDFFQSSMIFLSVAGLAARMMSIMSPVLSVGNVLEITLSGLSTRNSYMCP